MDYRYVTMQEATATAMLMCGGATQEDRLIFQTFVWEAMKHIGPTRHWIKVCKLTPKNGDFKKPKDLASTVDFALFDASNVEITYNYFYGAERIHTDRYTIHDNLVDGTLTGRVDISEDGYYFHMGNNADLVAYMELRYLALPINEENELVIPEDNIFAIAMFCRWAWSMRRNDNQSEIMNNRDTWYRERDRIYGNNKMPSVKQAKEFAKHYMSLINSYKPNVF